MGRKRASGAAEEDGVGELSASDGAPPAPKRRAAAGVDDEEEKRLREGQDFRAWVNRISRHSFSGKPSDRRVLKIENVRVLRGGRLVDEDLWVKNGRVIDPRARFWEANRGREFYADQIIDGRGCVAAPGFLDVQINGACGVDFSSPDLAEKDVTFVAQWLLRSGVTGFCPTVVTSSPATYAAVLPKLARRPASVEVGAAVLGAHVEGPFLSLHKYGAHDKSCLLPEVQGIAQVERVYGSLENVAVVTAAPEVLGVTEVTRELRDKGIRVCVGHSQASVEDGVRACREGASMVTHLFNAMAGFHHRDPGLMGLLGKPDPRPFYGVIADGVHSHPFAVNIAHRAHPAGLVLVTDAIQAMGLAPGRHSLGSMSVDIEGSRAYVEGTRTLAGSIVRMDHCVKNFARMTGCGAVQALEAASLHPAKFLGLHPRKGSLEIGADADIVLLSDTLQVMATFVGGQLAWAHDSIGAALAGPPLHPVAVASVASDTSTA